MQYLGIWDGSEYTTFVYIPNAEYSDNLKELINNLYLEPYHINRRQKQRNLRVEKMIYICKQYKHFKMLETWSNFRHYKTTFYDYR